MKLSNCQLHQTIGGRLLRSLALDGIFHHALGAMDGKHMAHTAQGLLDWVRRASTHFSILFVPSIVWDITTIASSAAVPAWVIFFFLFLWVLVPEEEVAGDWQPPVEVGGWRDLLSGWLDGPSSSSSSVLGNEE